MSIPLDEIIDELHDADREERVEMLIDFAKSLPPLPERFHALRDASHRVEECQSPVYLFVEMNGERLRFHADVPLEAPTVRGFVSILVQGLDGATVDEVLRMPMDLVHRAGLAEILGILRVRGLTGVLHRVKREATQAAIAQAQSQAESVAS